jgi:hypothetical protein
MAQVKTAATEFPWPNPGVIGLAWIDLFQKGAAAWTEASVHLARTLTEAGADQARALGELTAQAMAAPRAGPWLGGGADALRAELLLAGEQAELTADAVRRTLTDLGMAAPDDEPIPFPE